MIVLNTRMQIFFVLFVVSWLFVVASNFFRSLFGPTSGPTPLELTPLSSTPEAMETPLDIVAYPTDFAKSF